MRMSVRKYLIGVVSLAPALAACGSSTTGGAGGAGGGDGTGGGGTGGGSTQPCALLNDPGGPGQYADTCVKREWAAPYVGTYTSPNCKLTVTTPSGGPPAVFELVLTDATLGGTYKHDWEGGAGLGNDSYYRFTTDASFATTKSINFAASRKVSETEEHAIRLRINLDTATPSYAGGFARNITSPFSNMEADCGAFTFMP
jgi:hypothetical protein